MESSEADYESDWPSTMPNITSISPYTPDPEDRLTIQDLVGLRLPNIRNSTEVTTDEEFSYRMSAYDNVDDRKVPRAPPSEISEVTEFSEPWTEVSHGMSNTEVSE